MRSPAVRKASTIPSASGASGPTTVSTIASFLANSTSSGMPVMGTLNSPSSLAVPALPGATYTRATRGDCASRHAMACSLPPLPITSKFTLYP